jgi:hypothetical protein
MTLIYAGMDTDKVERDITKAYIIKLTDIIAELEDEAITAMKQHHELCWKIEKLQRQLAKRGMSQEEKNKTFHHDAKPGQGSFTMQQYKALKAEPKTSSEGAFWVDLEESLNQEEAPKEQE